MNRRPFCGRCTVCTVQHKSWGLLRYNNCAPFEAKRPDSLTPASCLEVVQRITGVMREIDGEIDALIGR
jgi:hypothetical protein